MTTPSAYRLEELRPRQIKESLDKCSLVYVPLGTIEWHCHHLPVGLDGLTAHGICLLSAAKTGGIVYPPLYYGTGGGHGAFPWTVILPDETEFKRILAYTLCRLSDFGVKRVVMFSGHFPDEQLDALQSLVVAWKTGAKQMTVLATSVKDFEAEGLKSDHAGKFETTLLHGLRPELVSMDQLVPLGDNLADVAWDDPKNETWGVYGEDPRLADLSTSKALVDDMAAWLASIASGNVKQAPELNNRNNHKEI